MTTFIDPPSGWKYGFPKALPEPQPENINAWLVANGYPQEEIDVFPNGVPYRFWEE